MDHYYRGFRLKVWNRLNESKGHIATELPSSSDQFKRWACIYADLPKNPSFRSKDLWKFQYLEFEVDKDRLGEDFLMRDVVVIEEVSFESEYDLFAFLEKKHLALAEFDAPWHHDYPL